MGQLQINEGAHSIIYNTDSAEEPDFFKLVQNAVLILAIYVFFVGWIYLYFLWKAFGISYHNLGIDFFSFYVYSFAVFKAMITIKSISFVLLFLLGIYFVRKKVNKNAIKLTAIIVLLCSFFYLYQFAKEQALHNAGKMKDNPNSYFKEIKILYGGKSGDSCQRTELEHLNEEGKLFFIAQTEHAIFVYSKAENSDCSTCPPEKLVHFISLDSIEGYELNVQEKSDEK